MKSTPSSPPAAHAAAVLLALAALAGCESRSGPGPEIHDSKYAGIDESGRRLPAGQVGECMLDQFTGLMWEVKTADGGLQDRAHTYTWFDPGEANGEPDYRGRPDGGDCEDSACDTFGYVTAVNQKGLCGYHDWRVPGRDELGSISDPRKTRTPPTINTLYFPYTQAGEYWSSNDYQFRWDAAWLWSFETGLDRVEWKQSPHYLRLVRGEAAHLERIED